MARRYHFCKTFFNFIDRLKQGLPSHVDRSLMNGYSGTVMSQLTHSLRALKLIGNNGETLPLLQDLVTAEDAKRADVIEKMLTNAYPFLARGFDLSNATTGTLDQ